LFAADNRQTWIDVIEPQFSGSLHADLLIVTDRSFMSSAAFQGANGVSEDFIAAVSIQQCRYVFYDKFYVVNTPLSVCQQRLQSRGIALDRVERFPQKTQERVCANYDRYIADGRFCGTPVIGVDGTKTTAEITLEIYNDIIAIMEKKTNA
jgi:thymidylate kinase